MNRAFRSENRRQNKKPFFEGWYFMHRSGGSFAAFIPGVNITRGGEKSAFIQVITQSKSYCAPFPYESFHAEKDRLLIRVGGCVFSKNGIKIDLQTPDILCFGRVCYGALTPLPRDVMGPFAHVPFLQCRHGVISMRHSLSGGLRLNGEYVDLDGGVGYIEKDSGRSFPEKYLWMQCCDFGGRDISVMLSVAKIPMPGFSFTGCIAAVFYCGREYRLATYLGAKVKAWGPDGAEIIQGALSLKASVLGERAVSLLLYAPEHGAMDNIIRESPSVRARFELKNNGVTVFCLKSDYAGFEFRG